MFDHYDSRSMFLAQKDVLAVREQDQDSCVKGRATTTKAEQNLYVKRREHNHLSGTKK